MGCGYSLSLYRSFSEAVSVLRKSGMLKGKLFMRVLDGEYEEVRI